MIRIMLCCASGMSTSLLVTRMLDYAKEKQINVHIEAHPVGEVESYGQDADVILLGPQVRFQLSHIKSRFPEKPVEVIDMRDYGMMDGQKVLNHVLEMMK